MSLANKTFKNNKTGESITVIDSFENIAVLENKQKIDVRTLMDPNQYTEQIDPNLFFNNQNSYNSLAEKIKNIPTNNIIDESGDVISINVDGNDNFRPAINESAIIMSSEEDEKAELARKYGATIDNGDSVTKQQQAFAKLLGEEPTVELNQPIVNQPIVNNVPSHRNSTTPQVQRVEVEDPIITMFRKTKRNVNFNVSIDISDKIPRLDFIEMMEDSYEISMIDFLADEFTNKILQDPSIIRDIIKSKIKNLVYGAEVVKSNVNDGITDSVAKKNDSLSIEKEPVLSKDLPKKAATRKPRSKKEQPKND